MDDTNRGISGEQWKRAVALLKSLSTRPIDEALGELEQSGEEAVVLEEVRQGLLGSSESGLWRTGLTVGRYVVGEALGRGAYGEVYRGRDTKLGRSVALKFLVSSSHLSKAGARRLLEEAQAASALNHPAIVTVHEVVDTESGPVMVMELIEGTTLREVLRQPIPEDQASRYAVQLLEALSAAHAAGIVHRDLKPQNLMVRPDGYLKVLDFGLARNVEDEGADRDSNKSALLGTFRYMSPEQCRSELATAASDRFSAGLILYELATGQHAFGGDSAIETARRILRSEPRTAARKSALADVAMKLMAKDPAKRPTAAEALELLQAGEEKKAGRVWKLPVLVAALSLAVAGAGVAVWWAMRPSEANKPFFIPMTEISAYKNLTAGTISPDGEHYLFADSEGLFHLPFFGKSSETEVARIPGERIDNISWIGGQKRAVLSSREISADAATGILRIVDLETNELQNLPFRGRQAIASPDGFKIAYVTVDGQAIEIASLENKRIVQRVQVSDPTGIKALVWSTTGKLIHYWTVPGGRRDNWRWQNSVMHTVDSATGQRMSEQTMRPLTGVVMLTDGRMLFNNMFGRVEEVEVEVATGRLRGPSREICNQGRSIGNNLSASANGRKIVEIFQNEQSTSVFFGDIDALTKRLKNVQLMSSSGDLPHAWTPDSEWVLYESGRLGREPIFRQQPGQKRAEILADVGGAQTTPQVSPDGKWVLFLSESPQSKSPQSESSRPIWRLMRIPIEGGKTEQVGLVQEAACQYGAVRCVEREYRNGELVFYELDPMRGRGRELYRMPAEEPDFGDWGLSPDGRRVSMVDVRQYPAVIRVLDLEHSGREQRVALEGPPPKGGLAAWSADGKGWFLAQEANRMLYYDASGHGRFVYQADFWAVPSPDGKRLAVVYHASESAASQVWR